MWRDPMEGPELRGRLLLLFGENGAGKTHCANAVHHWVTCVGHGKQFVKRTNHISYLSVIYWRWPNLLDVFKEGGWNAIEDMFDVPLLIIDELGGGHDPSRVGVDKLCQVLSRREGMWTMITTNTLPESWEETFDRRVASRFFRSAVHVDLRDVPDYGTMA